MDKSIPTPWFDSYPRGRSITMEYENISLFDFLKKRVEKEPNDMMIIFPGGQNFTYDQILQKVIAMAAHFQHLGLKKGDRIAIMIPNTPHYVIAHYAILASGCTVVQTNPQYTEHELTNQLKNSGAKAIVSLTMFQDKIDRVIINTDIEFAVYGQIQTFISSIKNIIGKIFKTKLFDPNGKYFDKPYKNLPNTFHFDDFILNEYEYKEPILDLYKDIAVYQYTGGTTGVSKGAMLSHRNVSINSQQAREVIHMIPDKNGAILTFLPLFHVFGMTVCMNMSIQLGIPMVLNVTIPADLNNILSWIKKYKISFFPAVPLLIQSIINHPKVMKTDFSTLKAVLSGGAPLPIEMASKFYKLTNVPIVEGYGLSETSPITHVNPIGIPISDMKKGSIGLPVADTLCKIVDPDDYSKILPLGKLGELCIKGPQIMQGYHKMPNETNNALKEDGWFKTGDIAKIDEEGYTYIIDRKKDIIVVKGYNVAPREIEEVLYSHPLILEAAVAGVTHPTKGEIIAAWIVMENDAIITENDVITYCAEYLPKYKTPKQISFRDSLPKSMIGKIMRRKLQEE